jgi:hypothetical protein
MKVFYSTKMVREFIAFAACFYTVLGQKEFENRHGTNEYYEERELSVKFRVG